MKQWFPFSDYDFYGYLACGFVTLFAIDYWCAGGQNTLYHYSWTFFQIFLVVALAYVTGQIIATPASIILENGLARRLLRPPLVILMAENQTRLENFVNRFLIGRYYSPLPKGVRSIILEKAEQETGTSKQQLFAHPEQIFLLAYSKARKDEDGRARMDAFRNQYGFCRNMAFTGLLSLALFSIKSLWHGSNSEELALLALSFLLSLGMLVRFLKFYSAFNAEVLRAYAFI